MQSRKQLIKRITLALFLAASCNLAWQFYQMYQAELAKERFYRENGFEVIVCRFGPPPNLVARFEVALFLLVALVATCVRGLKSTLMSVIGVSGSVIAYLLWWQIMFRVLENSGASPNAINHFLYLVGGNPVDIGIALAIGILVLLNVRDAALSSFRVGLEE